MTTDELVFTRVFDAPRELVFRCLIEPEHLTRIWGPKGTTTPLATITVDARPGGVFEATMVNEADGSSYPFRATYVEVAEPERLVWSDEHGVLTTSTFVALDEGRTEVTIRQSNVPAFFRTPEAQAGFLTSLDKLTEYLATLR